MGFCQFHWAEYCTFCSVVIELRRSKHRFDCRSDIVHFGQTMRSFSFM